MFAGQTTRYETFRAKFKIWILDLETLDGTDFSKDTNVIQREFANVTAEKPQIIAKYASALGKATTAELPSIKEESKDGG